MSAIAFLTGANPIPASSGNTVPHRLNRGEDGRLNRALHMAAITRTHYPRPAPTSSDAVLKGAPRVKSAGASSASLARQVSSGSSTPRRAPTRCCNRPPHQVDKPRRIYSPPRRPPAAGQSSRPAAQLTVTPHATDAAGLPGYRAATHHPPGEWADPHNGSGTHSRSAVHGAGGARPQRHTEPATFPAKHFDIDLPRTAKSRARKRPVSRLR